MLFYSDNLTSVSSVVKVIKYVGTTYTDHAKVCNLSVSNSLYIRAHDYSRVMAVV